MKRSRTVVGTSLGLALTIALLGLTGFLGLRRIEGTIDAVNRATAELAAYDGLQRALAQEGFAEASYLRDPGPVTAGQVVAASEAATAAAQDLRRSADARDQPVVESLAALQERHAADVRAELAAGRPGAEQADGPTLAGMQQLLDVVITRTTADLEAASAHQRRVLSNAAWRAPLALVTTLTLLALLWAAVVRHGRRAALRADASEQLALQDSLTGLGNRLAFERALAPELTRPEPDCAVLLLDLDGFKAINDTWGHDIGDDVLRAVAERLRTGVRDTDVVARLGGDEFVVLARPSHQSEVLRHRLQEAVAQPLHLRGVMLHPGVSIGLARVAPGASRDEVLREADEGLYADKRHRVTSGRRLGERRSS